MAEILRMTQHAPGPKKTSDLHEKEQKSNPFMFKKVYDENGKEKKFTPLEIMEDDKLRSEMRAFFSRIKSEIEDIDSKPDKEEWIRKIKSWNLRSKENTVEVLRLLLDGIDKYENAINEERAEKYKSKKNDLFSVVTRGASKLAKGANKGLILTEMLKNGADILRRAKDVEEFLLDRGVIQYEEIEQKKVAYGRG